MEYEMEMESLHIGFESESPPSGTECGAARKSGIYQAQRPAQKAAACQLAMMQEPLLSGYQVHCGLLQNEKRVGTLSVTTR